MIGTTLQNRYRLEAELDQGGMGTVYRAYDTLLDRPVALKVLSTTGLGTEGRARLLREARAAARLNHPNIMAIYDAGEANGMPFIVMELLPGRTLRDYQPHSLDEAVTIAAQICLALEHAHTNGIIHRDLKPENVMLLSSPARPAVPPLSGHGKGEGRAQGGVKVKLMDFGLAFHTGATRLTQEGLLVGTIAYLAPELIESKPATVSSDLYALGVMLYELAARRPPFTGETLMAVLSQHLYAPVVPPSTYNVVIPPALDALIGQLLAKRPEDRPPSAAEVHRALETFEQPSATAQSHYSTIEHSLLDRMVRGRLVGRERELADAQQIWQRAAAGEGQVLLISGEPGIGKTRFARELMAQARFNGAQVLLGECYAEGSAPYAPLAQVIQASQDPSGFGNPEGLTPSLIADLLTIAPALRGSYPDVPPNPPLEPQAEQQRIFDHVVAFLSGLAARAPVLLVVDDAHWADRATLALLRHVARRARPLRLLITLTYREIELDEARPFNTVLIDLNRERLATRLKLTRFDRDQTRAMLATLFQEEVTADFLDAVYRETEGNPFFIEEVCKALDRRRPAVARQRTLAASRYERIGDSAERETGHSDAGEQAARSRAGHTAAGRRAGPRVRLRHAARHERSRRRRVDRGAGHRPARAVGRRSAARQGSGRAQRVLRVCARADPRHAARQPERPAAAAAPSPRGTGHRAGIRRCRLTNLPRSWAAITRKPARVTKRSNIC